jgi:hypothetical protein
MTTKFGGRCVIEVEEGASETAATRKNRIRGENLFLMVIGISDLNVPGLLL